VDFWRPLAEDQGRRIDVALSATALPVPLASDDLGDLVDVLVDNVFAHTPEGTALRIELYAEGGQAVLVVSDAGPGLPARPRGERPGSTGLGLDIVARTARACGGDLRTGVAPEGGARVEVRLPTSAG
jgi:signal transduction histidine kinase